MFGGLKYIIGPTYSVTFVGTFNSLTNIYFEMKIPLVDLHLFSMTN